MKKLLIVLSVLGSFSAFATKATVDDAFCGEIDPFVVGDACIVQLSTSKGSKIALVFPDYELEEKIGDSAETLNGQIVDVDFSLAEKIYDYDVIHVLKSMGKKYFYMYAPIDAIHL
jgi:hypothetical protein